ncbi:MAG: hypothetical protein J6K51_00040 [Clostridia bacterium]|nr:hypothetical protein [Clostridia bacterium]
MKKSLIFLGISLCLFLICPWFTVLFAGMNGMAICFLLFFVINPLFFIVEGLLCGMNLKGHWWLPLASAGIYLLSSWVLFDMGETAFLIYAGLYLAVGVLSMLGAHLGKNLNNHTELR